MHVRIFSHDGADKHQRHTQSKKANKQTHTQAKQNATNALVLDRPVGVARLPRVELADERERARAGRPLPVPDAGLAVVLAAVEAIVLVA